jgi:hypothetical protein
VASLPTPAIVETKVINLNPIPPSATILVDGEKWGTYDLNRRTIELKWDRDYEIEFRNPCCGTVTRTVGPSQPPLPDGKLTVMFSGLPASLTVKPQPSVKGVVGVREIEPEEGQTRIVDTSGRLNEPISVAFRGDGDMRKKLQLTVVPDGGKGKKPTFQTVYIQAGETREVVVKLDD